MNKGYWIVRSDVIDKEKFGEYLKRTPAAISKYGGTVLVRAGTHEVVEGASRSRNTIIEFPSYQMALACWNSEKYQEAKKYRIDAAELDVVIIEGVE